MANMTYGDLQELTYAELAALDYSFQSTDSGGDSGGDSGDDSGGDSETTGGNCVWTSDRIAGIESQLTAILSKMDTLAKKSDVQLTTTTQTVQVTTQEVDLTEILSKMDTLAKPEDVQITVSADGIEVPTAADVSTAVWQHGTRTLTESPSTEVDLSEVTDKLEAIFALIARWSVSGNVLTAYTSSGATLGTFTLTRDAAGEIVGVQ